MSEIEKFNKFFTSNLLNIKPNSFNSKIDNLKTITEKYKKFFAQEEMHFEDCMNEIITTLHGWRQLYNSNKHEYDKLDNNVHTKEKYMYIHDSDVLEYVSDSIYHIIMC